MGIFGRKKPFSGSEGRFFDILSSQAAKTLEGLDALWNFAEKGTRKTPIWSETLNERRTN